jgi:cell surface protein SprA
VQSVIKKFAFLPFLWLASGFFLMPESVYSITEDYVLDRSFNSSISDTLETVPADTLKFDARDTLLPLVPIRGPRYNPSPNLNRRQRGRISQIPFQDFRIVVERDSLNNFSAVTEYRGLFVTNRVQYDFESYALTMRKKGLNENWSRLVQDANRRQDVRRGLLDFRINIPGGQRSAFTTIFGRPEVNLRVTGTANMNLGVSIQETEDPAVPPDQQRRIDPTFNQNLKLNIQGTIGDKLNIRTDWDTERAFNFENRLSIVYTGYEDEIIKSIELGNVSMETGNSLIRGGGALFGIKSRLQLGALELTGIISQQEGQGNSQTLSGGAQSQAFEIRPNAYDDNRHFFLDFYARQKFEQNMSDPTIIRRLFNITNVEVWVLNETLRPEEGQRSAIALLDYGSRTVGGNYLPPDDQQDRFDPAILENYRDPAIGVSANDLGVESDEFAEGIFRPLREGIDFFLDENLGYISLRDPLSPRQALAISFSYRNQFDQIVYVGDINQGDSQRLFLKLLRPAGLTPSSKAWPITMRNVYNLNSTNLTSDGLELDVFYTQGTIEQQNLPDIGNVLLQDLGLDRVGSQGQLGSDNQVDFGTGTLNPRDGRIIFPYLEPFGQRIRQIIEASPLTEAQKTEAIDRLVFTELYTTSRTNAQNSSKNNIYRIKGKTTGGVSESYFLNFQLIEGSVRVTANGRELVEGLDYEVDYSMGSILITNRTFLAPGQEIRIDYESNQFMQIQQTTFTGLRAEYHLNPDITLGSTYFRQKDRPLQDKIPVGDEPINNSVLGFDAKARFDTPWLTRVIDRVPLLQTRSPSSISLTGEFAQIRPGVSQTNAVSNAMRRGILYPDEELGLSFIDDFEGSKSSISFMSPGRWNIAAAPYALPSYDANLSNTNVDQSITSRIARNDLRAKFSWYTIPISLGRITGAARTLESLPVQVTDVFPDRDVLRQDNILQTLDIYYDPGQRGPYNYNEDLKNLTENRPSDMWGGFTTTLPSGLDDLTQNNIEFLEFWVQAILPDGKSPTAADIMAYDGNIYFDLGVVSEDVIPNNLNNTEDGLAERSGNLRVDQGGRSYVFNNLPDLDGQFSSETINLEDVGFDGAPNSGGIDGTGEDVLFASFVQAMEVVYADNPEMLARIRQDPSNDDFVYFDSPEVRELPLHKRFHRMYGYPEGNAITKGEQRAVTNRPDSEGLLNPAVVNLENSFYQYRVDFNPADTTSLRIGQNYVVDKVDGGEQWNTWYQIQIPLRDFINKIGNIENLQRVTHLRMWFTGYEQPFTVRFATLELVGNQWRKAEEVGNEGNSNTVFEVSTINIEENSNRRPVPYRIPEGAIRSINRGQQQEILANEQSLRLTVEDLRAGDVRLIKRGYPMGLNLTNYSNMRMFVHGEGYSTRNDIELVVRLGSDMDNNYYEYRQPITPTDTLHNFTSGSRTASPDDVNAIWLPDENSMNLILGSLNELKQLRNMSQADPTQKFELPNTVRNAPDGTILAIVGEPSLNRITEIGIGIRNPYQSESMNRQGLTSSGTPSLDAEIWVNELRVSGFEDESGWAANARAQIVMADFATVNASFNRSTDGFGPIDSRLGDRQKFDRLSYDLSSTVNMHRFIPERFGWNIPVTLSARQNTQTPRFLPREGDVRYEDFKSAVLANNEFSEQEKNQIINDKLREIQDFNENYSINLSNISKRYSQTKLGQYTLDNIRLSYVYNKGNSRDFRTEYNDNWNYTSGVNYQLNLRNVRTVRPFSFLRETPILKYLDELHFAYLPTTVTASATLNRTYAESMSRAFQNSPGLYRQQHNFRFSNQFGINYNILSTVSLAYNNTTNMDLAVIAQDSIPDSDNFSIRNSFDVLNDILTDDSVNPRRSDYQENWTATFRPRINKYRSLSWLNYSASYRGGFRWVNSALGSGLGSNLSNQYTLDQNPSIRIQDLLRKIKPYDKALRADEAERRVRDQERTRKSQARQRARAQSTNPQTNAAGVAANRPAVSQQAQNTSSRSLSDNIIFYSRRLMLSMLSFQNIDLTYSHSVQAAQQGYAGGSSIWDAFGDENSDKFSPSLGYRIGINSDISQSQLIRSANPNLTYSLSQNQRVSDNVTLRSQMQPIRDITIALDWNMAWERNTNSALTVGQQEINTQEGQRGSINASIWAFGGGYNKLFRKQLQAAFDDIGTGSEIRDVNGNADGRVVLSPGSLQQDFRNAYTFGPSKGRGSVGLGPLPLPNWRITWAGWEKKLPFLDRFLTRATIQHAYTGRFRLGWDFNPDFGTEVSRQLGSYRVFDERPEFQPGSVNVDRQFNPLVGLQMTWRSGLGTDIQYKSSKITAFSLSNTNVVERNSNEIQFTARYSKRGFTLPFFQRLQNTLDMSLTLSYIEDKTLTYRLNQDLQDVLNVPPDQLVKDVFMYTPNNPNERGDVRINIAPLIGYQFSQSVKANFEYRYSRLIPKSTGVFPRVTQDIRFNIIVSIRST